MLKISKYEILQIATLCIDCFAHLAFSEPASWGSHLEWISIKSKFVEFSASMCLSPSVVLWQGSGGTQKIALFGKRPGPYYGKDRSNKIIDSPSLL